MKNLCARAWLVGVLFVRKFCGEADVENVAKLYLYLEMGMEYL